MRAVWLLACLAVGCGSDGARPLDLAVADLSLPVDQSVPLDLTVPSRCGHPGDPGNSLGIGKYCVVQSDCTQGTLCAHPFSEPDYFCTLPCSPSNPSGCGEGAGCDCQNNQCGCLPFVCGGLPAG